MAKSEYITLTPRFMGYSIVIKSTAFIPCVIGFILFFTLIAVYGRLKNVRAEHADQAGKADV
jgi:hypothetical protein